MADIAPKLVELSADKLRSLHERLHKSEATPASLEVHHHTTSEMARRGMELGEDDWAQFEIEIDYLKDIDLSSLGSGLPEGLVEEVIKETGSSIGNVRTVLTIGGYALRIVPVEDDSVNKMIRQSKEGWTVYDHTGTRKFGTYGSKKEAEDRLSQIHRFSKAADYTPPKGVRVAARRALDWISEGKAGGGFTSVGRNRAQQLSAGENISLDTLKRMKAFFSRHEVDKEALGFSQGEKGYPSPGRVAWDAWGGDAGFSWAESTITEAENTLEKHLQGQHDQQSHAPQYARKMADSIIAGEHPSVGQKDVGPLFHGFAKLDDHPDITELKVEGTMMFGDEGLGIARKDMPQIPSKERDNFLADIEKTDGITFEKEKIDPTTLKPIQKEVSGSRAGKIYEKYKEEGDIPKSERILISNDGYVVDGHHTWAASVAFAFDKPGTELPVYRLSVDAKTALEVSNRWAKDNGFAGQALDAPTKKALIWQSLEKHGNHDQSTHGSWANGISVVDQVLLRAEQGKTINLGSYPKDRDDVISKYAYDKEKLGEVIHGQGWDKPSIGLTSNDFEKLAENSDFVRVYRGAPKGAIKGLLDGEPWIGNGQAGPGTYVSLRRERAELFARGVAMPDRSYVVHEFLVPRKMLESAQTREEVNNFIVSQYGEKSRFDSDAPQVLSAARGYGAHDATSHTGHSGDYVIYNTSALIVKLGG